MTRKYIKNFTAEYKTKVVLELLESETTISQLSKKYEITPKTIQNWKKQFFSNASVAFEPAKVVSEYKAEIEELKAQNDELAKALGKTTIERDWALGKLNGLDIRNKKDLVDSKSTKVSMTRQCELLNINRSILYYQPQIMSLYNKNIMDRIDEIYTENPEYGYRYIHQSLLEEDYKIGRDRTLKYMKMMGIEALYPKKKKSVSIQNKSHKIYPYLLGQYWQESNGNRCVVVPRTNEVWSGDITYIRTSQGFMYMAAIIDWRSKAILSYKLSNTMDSSLVTSVLNEALAKYPAPLIFNSDQGSQYTGSEHIEILQKYGIQISMNGKGRSIDNIIMERFFRTLKYNCIFINEFKSISELKEGINSYVNKYNNKRFHSSIGYKRPMDVYQNALKDAA